MRTARFSGRPSCMHAPPPDKMTDTNFWKYYLAPKLRLRAVIILVDNILHEG